MRIRALLLMLVPVPLLAQDGYDPAVSPYREIVHGNYVEVSAGKVYGSGGPLLVGPRDGTSESIRFTIRAKNTLQFGLGAWTAGLERSVIDADDSVATRNKGLKPQRLIGAEISIQFNITGGKSWHRLAPFAGVGFGLVQGASGAGKAPIDTSGYEFGTKLYFAPMIGTRLMLGTRAYLRLDARLLFWKLNYPASYSDQPAKQPGSGTVDNAVNTTGATSQYTATPELRIGFGISP